MRRERVERERFIPYAPRQTVHTTPLAGHMTYMYLVKESCSRQHHGQLTGIVRVICPAVVLEVVGMETAREAHNTIPCLTPNSASEKRVQTVLSICINTTLIIHDMLRKKGKVTQHNRKTKQHNTTRPRQLFFKKKSCLGWDLNHYRPLYRRHSYQLSYQGSSAGWA